MAPTWAATSFSHAVKRAGIDPGDVEDVTLGCANPEGATGGNIARQAAIRAGLPVTAAGQTVNRFCSSGLQAIALAAAASRRTACRWRWRAASSSSASCR